MTDTPTLIARLEKAEGPDRELANEVLFACGWTMKEVGEGPSRQSYWIHPDGSWEESVFDGDQPDPTESIDAALTLVPDEHDWIVASVNGHMGGTPYACVGSTKAHHAETPVIALCIAALRARESTP